MNLRNIICLTALAVIAAFPPTASAVVVDGVDVPVCNTASINSLGGDLTATDEPVQNPPSRYREKLMEKQGNGEGLINATEHSPALSLCTVIVPTDGDTGGGDTGDGTDPEDPPVGGDETGGGDDGGPGEEG